MIIAIIVSDRVSHCDGFLRKYDLNPRYFKKATFVQQLRGLDYNIPIILTYCEKGLDEDMYNVMKCFKSIRYIDY